jgi:ATP-binding cassette, subfamily F, member 3
MLFSLHFFYWTSRPITVRIEFLKQLYFILFADTRLVDLNALAWLEDYLQTWPGTLVVV